MEVAVISDRGLVRPNNEDSLLVRQDLGLFVVCDGMGGHLAGEVASKLAVDYIEAFIEKKPGTDRREVLNQAITEANRLIWQKGQENPEWHEMGTTVTAAWLDGADVTVANVGDSSLFFIRNGVITKITRDHTLAEDMVRDGLLDRQDVRSSPFNHILTRALGVENDIMIDNFHIETEEGDIILLCSDGLSDLLSETEILEIIDAGNGKMDSTAQTLLKQVLSRGGYDNISFILINV